MAERGKAGKAQATALHLSDGAGDTTPDPVDPPQWLSPEAQNIWQALAPCTSPTALTPGTASAFAMLCNALATYAEADQLIQEAGLLIAEGQALVPNPALAIRDRADSIAARWANLFGLTPDRTAAAATPDRPRQLPHLVEGG